MTAGTVLPEGWQILQFDQFLERVERKIELEDASTYERVGVRWYGNGAFIRDRVLGADVARKQQWVLRSGDVVYNKLFAWKGAFAVADGAVDGRIVSDKFPTYRLDEAQVEPRYLAHFFRGQQLAFQASRLSKGAAAISKLTLNPPQFWELGIPAPPVDEQARIADLLDEADRRVAEAVRLSDEAEAETAALISSVIGECLSSFPMTGAVKDVLVAPPRNGWSARCDNAEGGTAVLSLGAVTGFRFKPSEYKRTSEPTAPDAHYWLEPGDLLVTRSNTERLVGHAAIYTGDPTPCIYPDLMMKLKIDQAGAETRFVYYWLRSPLIRSVIERAGSGTNSSMKKITQSDVMGLPFPTGLALTEQRAVVQRLDELVGRVEESRSAQTAARLDLEALLPSLRDRAFSGELVVAA